MKKSRRWRLLRRRGNKISFYEKPQYLRLFSLYRIIPHKKRHPKVPSDLNRFNFNNMYWTLIQILFYYVKYYWSLRKNKITHKSAYSSI
ncbi:hypothetical protein FNE58_12600 [Bacillus thuringiensis]|nr:hypothetical protein FPG93_30855 [Bacillus thuringiensis]MDR5040332.1 hypothetical protein [Bacillus thuringiensis]QTM14020.1 hypothetical protein FM050_09070 [Bacillus thuringiensis]RBN52773.1 hypothetical protein DSD18_31195 [Bacillus thuringiensis]TBX83526.1 hypothetical protein E0M42_28610 [Bacillus thuringiensis]